MPNTAFTTNTTGDHYHNAPTWNGIAGGIYEMGSTTSTGYDYGGNSPPTSNAGNHSHTVTGGGDNETRPVNAYVNWIIKY